MKKNIFFNFRKSEHGQGVIEMALVLPLLMLLLCGIMDFGWIFMNQYTTDYATYNAARYASILASNTSNSTSTVISKTTERVRTNLLGSDTNKSKATITVTIDDDDEDYSDAIVTVKYPIKCLTFVGSSIFGEYYNATCTRTYAIQK